MALILLVLLLVLLLGGLGFAVHILWWIALIVLVVWVLGFLVRVGEGGSRGRWYRWLPARRARLAARRLDVTHSGRPGRGRPLLSSPPLGRHHVRMIGIAELPCAGLHPGQVRA
jgi:hypothetical protein